MGVALLQPITDSSERHGGRDLNAQSEPGVIALCWTSSQPWVRQILCNTDDMFH